MRGEILEIVRERCSSDFFSFHIIPVVVNTLNLRRILNLGPYSLEVIEPAAYLHDIGRFQVPKQLGLEEDHHIVGAQMAREIMKAFGGYSEEFIKDIEHCILTHRGKKGPKPETQEAEVIACADAMAHFDGFFYVLKLFFDTSDTFEEAIKGVEQKMLRDWQKLTIPQARDMSRKRYEAVLIFLESLKKWSERELMALTILIDGMISSVA